MSQKLPVKDFKLSKFIKKYDDDSRTGHFLEKDLSFLPERKTVEKVEKLICSIEEKEKYVIHINALKQASNHGLVLKKYTE